MLSCINTLVTSYIIGMLVLDLLQNHLLPEKYNLYYIKYVEIWLFIYGIKTNPRACKG